MPVSTSGWDEMADWWDANMGDEGDLWHRALIDPPMLRLVGDVAGKRLRISSIDSIEVDPALLAALAHLSPAWRGEPDAGAADTALVHSVTDDRGSAPTACENGVPFHVFMGLTVNR